MPKFTVLESCSRTHAGKRYAVCAPTLRAAKVAASKNQKFGRNESYLRIRDQKNKLLASKAFGRWY